MSQYQVTGVWWPDGWEPNSPLDVPNCPNPASEQTGSKPLMSYKRALATARSLNRQNLDRPGTVWFVVAEVDEGVPADAAALRVLRPIEGAGHGNCSHCPAHQLPCAAEDC